MLPDSSKDSKPFTYLLTYCPCQIFMNVVLGVSSYNIIYRYLSLSTFFLFKNHFPSTHQTMCKLILPTVLLPIALAAV